MSQERRKQLTQIIILVVLLLGLGFSMMHMIRTVGGGGQKQQRSARATAQQSASEQQPAATTTAPAGESGAKATADETPAGPAAATPEETIEMNANLFRVHEMSPPKNPFVQREEWYQDELSAIPGYPDFRDLGYFESMQATIPVPEGLLDEDEEWRWATMQKRKSDKTYNISGTSEDGMIVTDLKLGGPAGEQTSIEWSAASTVPLTELSVPGWDERYGLDLSPQAVPSAVPDASDLFQPPGDGGLQVPGLDQVQTGSGTGEEIRCRGVSGIGANATALISLNGTPRLIKAGDSLPPKYSVDAITADGVILIELRNGETRWLPITGG
ncbi:hypothetical protein JW859_14715 [bacterium]|nr:hypothetical protein [bacterium]